MTAEHWRHLYHLADRLRPTVRRRFLVAVFSARARVNLEDVELALAERQFERVEQLFGRVLRTKDLATVASALRDLYDKAGLMTIQTLSVDSSMLRFDLTNPRAIAWAERHVGALITEITDGEREAIRQVIARTVRGEQSIGQTARELRSMVGLTTRQRLANISLRLRLIEDGMTSGQAADRSVAYARQQLAERAEVLASTETMAAVHAGQLEAWQEAREAGGLNGMEKVWIITPDSRLCPRCGPMEDQRRRIDEPFVELGTNRRVMMPPLHPKCRCTAGLAPARRRAARDVAFMGA